MCAQFTLRTPVTPPADQADKDRIAAAKNAARASISASRSAIASAVQKISSHPNAGSCAIGDIIATDRLRADAEKTAKEQKDKDNDKLVAKVKIILQTIVRDEKNIEDMLEGLRTVNGLIRLSDDAKLLLDKLREDFLEFFTKFANPNYYTTQFEKMVKELIEKIPSIKNEDKIFLGRYLEGTMDVPANPSLQLLRKNVLKIQKDYRDLAREVENTANVIAAMIKAQNFTVRQFIDGDNQLFTRFEALTKKYLEVKGLHWDNLDAVLRVTDRTSKDKEDLVATTKKVLVNVVNDENNLEDLYEGIKKIKQLFETQGNDKMLIGKLMEEFKAFFSKFRDPTFFTKQFDLMLAQIISASVLNKKHTDAILSEIFKSLASQDEIQDGIIPAKTKGKIKKIKKEYLDISLKIDNAARDIIGAINAQNHGLKSLIDTFEGEFKKCFDKIRELKQIHWIDGEKGIGYVRNNFKLLEKAIEELNTALQAFHTTDTRDTRTQLSQIYYQAEQLAQEFATNYEIFKDKMDIVERTNIDKVIGRCYALGKEAEGILEIRN